LKIWLNILVRYLKRHAHEVVTARRKAEQEEFDILRYAFLDANKMIPGMLCMHILHEIITTGV
jgi:hypothetical protein